MQAALDRVFTSLPRQGPGSDDATRFAAEHIATLRDNAVIYDLGCGTGAQTLTLADKLQQKIIAVDQFRPFLERLRTRAEGRNAAELIQIVRSDFSKLDWQDRSVDLIWCEGAVYNIGFVEALRAWRPKLCKGGYVVVSECCWLTRTPPLEAKAYWADAYPSMRTTAGNIAAAKAAGYSVEATFDLPPEAWWRGYYDPVLARIAEIRDDADEALQSLITGLEQEVKLRRDHGTSYGYVFFILRRTATD